MTHISIFGNTAQKTNLPQLATLIELLHSHSDSVTLSIDQSYARFLTDTVGVDLSDIDTFDTYEGHSQLALSIGGDGTFLTTAARVGASGTPIMGINSGHLGYLSAADICSPELIVDQILTSNYSVEPRTLIKVTSETLSEPLYALNEVAILKQDTASMITITAFVRDQWLADYRADGLIVSTPTGSTGYNLSVGGPIVAPMSPCWVISPIAPHSLNMRPLVLPDTSLIRLSATSRATTYLLSVDGRATAMPLSAGLKLVRAPFHINVVRQPHLTFADTIRKKLLWGIDGQI